MKSWLKQEKKLSEPTPLYYIDEATLPIYRARLIADITKSTSPTKTILEKHQIKLPVNYNQDKESILRYVNLVCDSLGKHLHELYKLIDKITFIKNYLIANDIKIHEKHMSSLIQPINFLFSNKANLFNDPLSPVKFNRIVTASQQHDLWITECNRVLNELKNSPDIEVAILFNLESTLDANHPNHLRNVIRHCLLKYCVSQNKNKHSDFVRGLLQKLSACSTQASILSLLRDSSPSLNRFFNPRSRVSLFDVVWDYVAKQATAKKGEQGNVAAENSKFTA